MIKNSYVGKIPDMSFCTARACVNMHCNHLLFLNMIPNMLTLAPQSIGPDTVAHNSYSF